MRQSDARIGMATQDLSETPKLAERAERAGSIGMVLLVALGLIGAAVAFLLIGRNNAQPYILAFLSALAVTGVFSLFAGAAGILRLPGKDAGNAFASAAADGAPDAIVVTDVGGRVLYANAAYLTLVGAAAAQDARPVERVFIGDPDLSEAVYRLAKAAREGRQLQEEVRLAGPPPRWLRFRVRPLGATGSAARSTVWSVADVTRDRERQENVFQELQHAIDYLDHAPAGFFSVDAAGDVGYLNATLANWLDHDLAQIGSGGLNLTDIVAGEGAALLTTLAAAPGEVKTEVLDLDLKTRSGRTLPARLLHKVAFAADGTPGASRTLVLNRAREEGGDPQRAAGDRHRRPGGPDRPRQCTVRASPPQHRQGRTGAGGGAVHPRGRRRARPGGARRRDRPRRGGSGRDRADRCGAGARRQPLGALLRVGGREERARRRGGDRLCGRDHRAARARSPVHPIAKDGSGRSARRRHRPRFQQRALRHHDGDRFPAQRPQADRSVVPGHHADQAERQPGGEPGAAIAGVLAAADIAPAGARSRRGALRPDHAAAAPDRREGHARGRARARPVVGPHRSFPIRAGDRQSRGQCQGRDARRRQARDQDAKSRRGGMRGPGLQADYPGRLCADRGRRHRARHRAGTYRQDLRTVLLDQGGRQRYRARPFHRLRHRQADRRIHRPALRGWPRP